ncbi:MAG: glycoside hydrolase family 88/105 protein [Asticcacaulis sp.]
MRAENLSEAPWRPADVIAMAEKVGSWQIADMAAGVLPGHAKEYPSPTSWEQGAFFVGLAALADHSRRPEYAETLLARGEATGWQPGPRPYHADDYAIAASYFWDARHGAGDEAIAPLRARLDYVLANRPAGDLTFPSKPGDPDCQARWCWCDALFMAPPVWLEMSKVTSDPKYADFAKSEFQAATKRLYDPETHLYFRDSRFFDRRDADGQKVFWSRGDGWVFAGLARMIPILPAGDADRAKMIVIFKEMAAELKSIQKPDGFWSPSLLSNPDTSLPEESGTAFYTFGMAWGIRAGILDRAAYEPVARAGWAALTRTIHPNGKVGFVQPVGDRPDEVGYDDTQLYGTGGFLLAATAIADLNLRPGRQTRAAKAVR